MENIYSNNIELVQPQNEAQETELTKKFAEIFTGKDDLHIAQYHKHLTGEEECGIYPIRDDGCIKFIIMEILQSGYNNHTENDLKIVAEDIGIHCNFEYQYLPGRHRIFFVFNDFIEFNKIEKVMQSIIDKSGVGIESVSIIPNRFGDNKTDTCEFVKLPFFGKSDEFQGYLNKLKYSCSSEEIDRIYADVKEKEMVKSGLIILADQPTPPDVEYIIDGLIPKNFITILYAEGGTGKTLLALYIAILAAEGRKTLFNNINPSPNSSLNVLWLDYELDQQVLTREFNRITHGLDLAQRPRNLYYKQFTSNLDTSMNELEDYIKRNNIGFIVIDSAGCAGIDAMDEKKVIYTLNQLKNLKTTSLIIDHQAKSQTKDISAKATPFGSVYKSNLARSQIHATKEAKQKGKLTIRLKQNKSNLGPEQDSILVDILFSDEVIQILPSDHKTKEVKELERIRELLIELTSDGKEVNQRQLISELSDEIARDKLIKLLEKGTGKFWDVIKGNKNANIYTPIVN